MSKAAVYLFLLMLGMNSLPLISAAGYHVEDKVMIHIRAITTVTLTKFDIDVYKSKRSIKLVYALFDSLRRTALCQDTAYQRVNAEQIRLRNISSAYEKMSRIGNLVNIIKRYDVYDKDSIMLKTDEDTAYVNLING